MEPSLRSRIASARTGRRAWWVSFAIFSVLGLLWATALPLFGSPDEPAHVTRAVSVARGEWIGDRIPGLSGGWREVEVPAVVESANDVGCYAFRNDVSAACLDYSGSDRRIEARTTAGTSFPGYYLVVGLPSLLTAQARGVYLMRFLSAILGAALLASALASVRAFPNPRVGAVGLAVAVTPMVLFVNGTVNPSSLEISAAIAAWASACALLAAPAEGPIDRRLVIRVAVALSALGLSRLFAPMWIVAILGTAGLIGGLTLVRRALRDRGLQMAALAVAVATSAQLVWNIIVRPVDTGTSVEVSQYELIRNTIGRSGFFYESMIGTFGWLNVNAPYLTVVVWTAAIGVLLVLGLSVASRRASVALLLVAAATALLPLVSEYREVPIIGPFWQGRYTLPLAVGVPIVGAYLIGTSSVGARLARSRLALVVGLALGTGQFLGFAQTLRRFTVGINGPFQYWLDAPWSPPFGALTLTVAYVAALAVWLIWMLGPTPEDAEPVS
ncbi:MAG: DUF2142 domain-containing protein [Actinomycetes bacterium]